MKTACRARMTQLARMSGSHFKVSTRILVVQANRIAALSEAFTRCLHLRSGYRPRDHTQHNHQSDSGPYRFH